MLFIFTNLTKFLYIPDDSEGWRGRQKQNEAHNRKILASDMNEASMSSAAASTNDSHTDVECQKATHKESSPPNIFNNSSSLKYLHKKFKRVASAIIEEHCDKVKANANANLLLTTSSLSSTESSSLKYDAALNLNGEVMTTTPAMPVTAVQSSHINESETNSQDVVVDATTATVATRCIQCRKSLDGRRNRFCNECNPELINAVVKYGNNMLRNEFSNKNVGADLRACGTRTSATVATAVVAVATASVQHASHKRYERDLIDSLSKSKNDISNRLLTVCPLQQQKTNKHYGYDSVVEDFGAKVNQMSVGDVPQNFKENLIKSAQHDLTEFTVRAPNVSGECSNAGYQARRKNHDKSYPCITCGIDFKSRNQYYKHCRFVESSFLLKFNSFSTKCLIFWPFFMEN